jgi:hypothetical protein
MIEIFERGRVNLCFKNKNIYIMNCDIIQRKVLSFASILHSSVLELFAFRVNKMVVNKVDKTANAHCPSFAAFAAKTVEQPNIRCGPACLRPPPADHCQHPLIANAKQKSDAANDAPLTAIMVVFAILHVIKERFEVGVAKRLALEVNHKDIS